MDDYSLKEMIRLLNTQQRLILDRINVWAKYKLKHQNSIVTKKNELFCLFINGGEGFGKYHLV